MRASGRLPCSLWNVACYVQSNKGASVLFSFLTTFQIDHGQNYRIFIYLGGIFYEHLSETIQILYRIDPHPILTPIRCYNRRYTPNADTSRRHSSKMCAKRRKNHFLNSIKSLSSNVIMWWFRLSYEKSTVCYLYSINFCLFFLLSPFGLFYAYLNIVSMKCCFNETFFQTNLSGIVVSVVPVVLIISINVYFELIARRFRINHHQNVRVCSLE